jgi:hypothetical protein
MRIRAKLVHKLVECGALRQVAQQAATAIRGSICKFRVNKALRLKTCVNMLQNLQQLQKQTIFWYDLSSLKYVVCAFLYAPWSVKALAWTYSLQQSASRPCPCQQFCDVLILDACLEGLHWSF